MLCRRGYWLALLVLSSGTPASAAGALSRLGPVQPRREAPRYGKKPKTELARRVAVGDRRLAELISRHWNDFDPATSFDERIRKIVGQPLPWKHFDILRSANPDLLGHLEKSAGLKYTPVVRKRLGELIESHPDLSYDELSRHLDRDPILSKARSSWDGVAVADVVKRFPDEFTRRAKAVKAELSPELWGKVHAALLAHPSHTYVEVAELLNQNAAFVTAHPETSEAVIRRLVSKFGSRADVDKEREDALAKRLATRMRGLDQELPIKDMLAALGDELPHVSAGRFRQLREDHAELGAWSWDTRVVKLTPAVKERIHALMLEHPTLKAGELAKLFRADEALAHLEWSPARVEQLASRAQTPLASVDEREAALARHAADLLSHLPAGTTLAEGIRAAAEKYPGFKLPLLVRLSAREPRLAKAVERLRTAEAKTAPESTGAGAGAGELSSKALRGFRFTRGQLAQALARPDSRLVAGLMKKLEHAERVQGDHDGKLAPRDLADADPATRALMAEVYAQLGQKTLALDAIRDALPKAAAAVAGRGRSASGAAAELYEQAAAELVEMLAHDYRQEVVTGNQSTKAFVQTHRLEDAQWSGVRRASGELFPKAAALPLAPARVSTVASLYRRVLDGEISGPAFYERSGLTPEQVLELQAALPARFPRPPGTPVQLPFSGHARAHAPGDESAARADEDPRGHLDERTARAVAKRAQAMFDKDVLVERADIVAALNHDPAFVERFGEVDVKRYGALQALAPDEFPRLRDPKVTFPKLAEEVRELYRRDPSLGRSELAAQLSERHPNFKVSRVDQLREAYPDLIPKQAPPSVEASQRERDAERVSALQRRHPDRTIAELAEELGKNQPRFTAPYLYRLRREFRGQHFAGMVASESATRRGSFIPAKLFELALAVAPPGADEAQVGAVVAELLAERGAPRKEGAVNRSNLLRVKGDLPTLTEHGAEVTSEVLAEYARAAKRSAPEKEIFDAVKRDYPLLTDRSLAAFRALWDERPADFPALAPFVSKKAGELVLTGRGEHVSAPRFLGGWDPARVFSAKDAAQRTGLAEAAQYARIPLHLPLLDDMVGDLHGRTPLHHTNVLWVSHLLGSTVPLALALKSAGASAPNTIVVGSPYGTNEAVREALAASGFDVRVPALSQEAYRKVVAKAVDDAVARFRQNHAPVVVLDDGGLVTEILRSTPKYADVLDAFKIVEQTTRGITVAEQQAVKTPIINVARSRAKELEGTFIGRAVALKVIQGLGRLQQADAPLELKHARVVVLGHGVVGSALATELRKVGADVTVVESSEARAEQARKAGLRVADKETALPKADIVIGATGTRSLTLEDLGLLKSGAVVASASSKQVEIDMEGLRHAASTRTELDAAEPLVRLPTARYRLGRSNITVLGDGWPVNFDGDVEDIAAHDIQLTRAVMFAGALQAASLSRHDADKNRILPLDEKVDRKIVERFRRYQSARGRGHEAAPDPRIGPPDGWAGDPGLWTDVVRDVARRFTPAPGDPPAGR